MTLAGFVRQHRNYGGGAHRLHRRRAAADGAPMRVEPLGFYAGLIASPLRGRPLREGMALAALLVLAQAANAVGFFEERFRSRGAAASPARLQ